MTTYISILRGINVSGQKMIKMDTLRKMYSDLAFKNVQTYIQSGNVIFQAIKMNHEELERKISNKIFEELGFQVPVIVKSLDEITTVLNNNPFVNDRKEDLTKLHVTFLSSEPERESIEKILNVQSGFDEFILIGKIIYLFCPNGYGKTKFSNTFFENKLKITATTRNWKTINELFRIANNINQ